MSMNTVSVDRELLEEVEDVLRECAGFLPGNDGGIKRIAEAGRRLTAALAQPEQPAKITCHAEGERCHGCAHYRGEADVCEFAEQPEAGRDFKQGAEREPPVVTGQVRKIEPPVTIYRQRKANGSMGIYLEDQRSHLCECETDVDAWGIANALNATTRPQEQGKPTSAACSRCHTVEGDCDALVSDDPTACPCRCHEPQVQEAVAYTHPAHAEAVRVVSALRSLWRTKDGALDRCTASVSIIEMACREADTFLAQHGGQGDE